MCVCVCVFQLLAILGEQFIVGDEICGVVISIRSNEDIISLWNRTAFDTNITSRIRQEPLSFRTPFQDTIFRTALSGHLFQDNLLAHSS